MHHQLSPYASLPARDSLIRTVLLVGPPGIGKRTLAREFLSISSPRFHCHTTESLPLVDRERPRVDYVVLMVDMTSTLSLQTLKRALKALDPEYFLGRCCVVVTRVDKVTHWAFEKNDLEEHVEQLYDIPILNVNLSNISARALLVDQLARAVRIACGHMRGITPSLLRSVETTEVNTTLFPA